MSRLVNDLIRNGYLRTDLVIDAFSEIQRVEFVPEDMAAQADANIPLPIGHGQTISQPLTVAFMFELLDPQRGHNILDVGSGSGWTTGMLAYIAGEKGHVTGLEIIKELCDLGEVNVNKYSFVKKGIAEFCCQSAENGFEKNAPYDRILVSASVEEIPQALKDQLATGGKMVLPVFNDIWYVEKKSASELHVEKFPGFAFVPFIKK
ncbi:MAG TPA: class I SAM-dependent methyltransferase [Patescibacteria group bacterium]